MGKSQTVTARDYYKRVDETDLFDLKNIQEEYLDAKNWGFKTSISRNHVFNAEAAFIVKGGFSSWHCHWHRHNTFFVPVGSLKLSYEQTESGTQKEIMIGPSGQLRRFEFAPGIWHKFEALEDTILIEIYSVRNYENDIEREEGSTGGIKNV